MKNRLLILFQILFLHCNIAYAQNFVFETENIEIIKSEEKIISGKGIVYSEDNNFEISANRFEYLKNLELLRADGNGKIFIKNKNIIIEFKSAEINKKKSTIQAYGNVRINFQDKKILFRGENVVYFDSKNIIESNTKSIIEDKFRNRYIADNFRFEIAKDILKLNNLELIDQTNNSIFTEIAYVNTNSGNLFGKDIVVNYNRSENQSNQPRLKANKISKEGKLTSFKKGVFTTCKARDDCPPWQISSDRIVHDQEKKQIFYEKALLKFYNIPVLYFPKFFHPDPSVKRQSGFLTPNFTNSKNLDSYINTPYFFAISDNKDATFSPRFFFDNKFLLQTEYRQKNYKSDHVTDFSFFLDEKKKFKNHFFYNYDKEFDFLNFNNSTLNFKLQNTNSETYLKANKLESDIVKNINVLENSLGLNLYSNDLSLSLETSVYEDLNKKGSDKYEYILPNFKLSKNLNTTDKLNGNLIFNTSASIRQFNTNVLEKKNINNFLFNSLPIVTEKGFYNNYKLLVKNTNQSNKNTNYKNDQNLYLSSIFQYNSSLPLINENNNYSNILKPKISIMIAPPHTKKENNNTHKIDLNNIYSIDRFSNDTVEGGGSIVYGSEYTFLDKNESTQILNIEFANNLRLKENNDLNNIYQMNDKFSNLFTSVTYNPNKYFTSNYKSSIKNNFKDISEENIKIEFNINNFVTEFDYLNENNTSINNSYLKNKSTLKIDQSNSLIVSTKENKDKDLTEYYNFMYQYKNDCLVASLEYTKNFYNDRDLKPEKNFLFRISIIPDND